MSEQPNNVISLDDYRQGSRFDNDTHVDLHKNTTVPDYDPQDIARVHQIDAARRAREAAIAAEQYTRQSGPELAGEDLARLAAVRRAVLSGQIGFVA